MGDQTLATAVMAIEDPSAEYALGVVRQVHRRQVVVDILATAIVDLLLKERSRVRGKHESGTC
jgi:hypothetical protein